MQLSPNPPGGLPLPDVLVGPKAPCEGGHLRHPYVDRPTSLGPNGCSWPLWVCLCTGVTRRMMELVTAGVGFGIVYMAQNCGVPHACVEQAQEYIRARICLLPSSSRPASPESKSSFDYNFNKSSDLSAICYVRENARQRARPKG